MDSASSNRLKRRTAHAVRELMRYKIQITALSQTRLVEEGDIKYVGTGYTFFWIECKCDCGVLVSAFSASISKHVDYVRLLRSAYE